MKLKLLFSASILSLVIWAPEIVGAVGLDWSAQYLGAQAPNNLAQTQTSGTPVNVLVKFVGGISSALTYLATAVGILFIVLGGFWMVTGAFSQDNIDKGKKTILWVFAGLLVIIFAFKIVEQIIKFVYAVQ